MRRRIFVETAQFLYYKEQVLGNLKKEYLNNLSPEDEDFIFIAFALCVSVEDTAEIMNLYDKESKDGY